MKRISGWFLLLALLFPIATPSPALAQDPHPGGVLFQTQGDVDVPLGAGHRLVLVARGNLTVEGKVGTVILIDGEAEFTGAEVDEAIIVNGVLRLRDGSTVRTRVQLIDSEIDTDASSQVLVGVQEGARTQMLRGFWAFGTLVAIGYAIAMILGSMIAAGVAPHGVRVAGQAIADEPMKVVLWGLGAWVLLPLGAMALIPTIIGLPIGIGMFVFVLPTLAFLGYLIVAIRLGDFLMGRIRKGVEQPRPYRAAVIGTVLLLALGILPGVGGMIPMLAGAVGTGAVLLTLARGVGVRASTDIPHTIVT